MEGLNLNIIITIFVNREHSISIAIKIFVFHVDNFLDGA